MRTKIEQSRDHHTMNFALISQSTRLPANLATFIHFTWKSVSGDFVRVWKIIGKYLFSLSKSCVRDLTDPIEWSSENILTILWTRITRGVSWNLPVLLIDAARDMYIFLWFGIYVIFFDGQ